MKKLFILDSMALAHRCWWVHKELKSKDRYTGTAYGAATFLTNLIQTHKPEYFIAVTDLGGKTFRHEMYPEYKNNRSEKEPEFKESLRYFFELLTKLQIPILGEKGYEADDMIGSVVKQINEPDLLKWIISGDKDFMQLIDQNTSLYKPGKWPNAELVTIAKVFDKIGVMPEQVIDYLSLVGDTADNVPGVKGVGPKGAAQLLNSFGTLDGIYQNFQLVKGKKNIEGLKNHRDSAYLSKSLVTIKTDLSIDLSLERMELSSDCLTSQDLYDFYREYEFNSLLSDTSN